MESPIQNCPHCGSSEGYYTKEYVWGSVHYRHNFDGSEAENGEMYDSLKSKGGEIAYCVVCDKRLFKMNEEVQNEFSKD